MIRFLRIQHLAVIDALELELEPGLNVLTGETGAGKSVIVEALGLLLGGRASADLVRTGEAQASVQAIFEVDGRETIVRREITAQGRSRAFIDEALAVSVALKELGSKTVDLHGQHEHQLLLNPATHLDVLDEDAQLGPARAAVGAAFHRYRAVRDELARVRANDREKAARGEFVAFQLAEIDRVGPRPDEDVELATTRRVLANADRLQRLSAESYSELYEGDEAVLPALANVWKKIVELASLDPRFVSYVEARDGVRSQLEDLAFFLREYAQTVDTSPERLQEVEMRLLLLERLKKKYGPTLADVVAHRAALIGELEALETASERAAALETELEGLRAAYVSAAGQLSAARRRQAPIFARKLVAMLSELAMERTRCELRFVEQGAAGEAAWTDRGIDEVEFFLSPNVGEELRPLAKIASGGELSRIMLGLKTLAATDAAGKTLVFDEVDAGIGGRVADIVGRRLRQLADRFQVICITHLPQIASHAATHFFVAKTTRGSRTVTRVERLDEDARVEEIARMMAGAEVSEHVRASARDLLRRAREENTKLAVSAARAKGQRG